MDTHYTGNKITEIRKVKGWTQKVITDKLHTSSQLLQSVNGNEACFFPDLILVEDLAQILDVSKGGQLNLSVFFSRHRLS